MEQLADMFGIGHIMNKYPAQISGGEKQRAAVARSMINRPLIILADEPTGNLDSKSGCAVIEAFAEAKKQMGKTIFMVTHDSFCSFFLRPLHSIKRRHNIPSIGKNKTRSMFQDKLLEAIKEMNM